ncbi:unnamed protein product [Ectocarpus sp. 12 AP-2014]
MTMTSNTLTLNSAEDLSISSGSASLTNFRLEVINGTKLFWETSVFFLGDLRSREQCQRRRRVCGRRLHRAFPEGRANEGRPHHQRDLDADNAVFVRDGGCVWTAGFFQVDGEASFTSCAIIGAGESPTGSGGAVFMDVIGSVLFNQGDAISDTFITNDGGGDVGGDFHLGKVSIKEGSRFEDLSTRSGAAIFNARMQASGIGRAPSSGTCRTRLRGKRSTVVNLGFFKFSGPAFFVDAEAPVIVATEGSTTIISRKSTFWTFENDDITGDAICVSISAEVSVPGSVSFVGF